VGQQHHQYQGCGVSCIIEKAPLGEFLFLLGLDACVARVSIFLRNAFIASFLLTLFCDSQQGNAITNLEGVEFPAELAELWLVSFISVVSLVC